MNPNAEGTAFVELSLVTSESTQTKNLQIPAKGLVQVDVADFFEAAPLSQPSTVNGQPGYLLADSSVEIAGFELVGKQGTDLLGLNARPASELLTTLLFPQLAVLGPFITEAVIGNFSQEAAILTLTAYQGNGQIFTDEVQNNPVVMALDPGETIRADLEDTFGFSGPATLEGWLKVESTSQSINGSISYALPEVGPIASVSSVRAGSRRALFSHIGTSLGFFTGLATLNGAALAANVRVVALKPDSQVLGTFTTTLQPGERRSELLTDIIPEADGQAGGMIWIESDVPVYLTAIFGSVDPQKPVFANVPPQPVPESFEPDMGIAQLEVTPPLAVLGPGQAQQFQLTQEAVLAGATVWGVNGQAGGSAQTGTISAGGLYTAPGVLPQALPVTITAATDNQTAGASVDVQARTLLVGGLGIVQSVAYLEGLKRLYTSELSFGASPSENKSPQGSQQSTIFEFDETTEVQQSVAVFGDDIPKMIGFTGSDGKEYLLLAGRNSGSIRRLDPQAETSVEVATGLNGPNSLVIDPVTGNLLVAEVDQVSTIPVGQLNQGLTGAGPAQTETRGGARTLVAGLFPTGVAVDPCTGDVYVSQAVTGEVLKIDRFTGEMTVLVGGLYYPTHMLLLSRLGMSCPLSSHLLVVEKHFSKPQTEASQGQIRLIVPATGTATVWVPFGNPIADITLQPDPDSGNPSVLLAKTGQIDEVEVTGRYESQGTPINPPTLNPCLGSVNLVDSSLEAAARDSLGLTAGPQGKGPDPITCQDALDLVVLDGFGRGIHSLEGIQSFENLQIVDLFFNSVSDVTPLASLTRIWILDLGQNRLTEIGALAGLTGMINILLDDNSLADGPGTEPGPSGGGQPHSAAAPVLWPLANMNHLELVLLGDDEFNLGDNQIRDLSPLAGASRLSLLEAFSNEINDLTPLSGLKQLDFLGVADNQITDISVVRQLDGLTRLSVSDNPMLDMTPISDRTNLVALDANSNSLTNIGFLSGLTNLESLFLANNNINDIGVLQNLRNLEDLGLSNNPLLGFGSLAPLSNLRTLRLFNTGVGDLGVGSHGPSGNGGGELDFLTGLTRLEVLDLGVNEVANLGPLSGLTALQTLYLDSNNISDIAALVANSGLGQSDFVDLQDNLLGTNDCDNLQILIDLGVDVFHDVSCFP